MKRLNWPEPAAGSHSCLLALLDSMTAGMDLVAKVRAIALLDDAGRALPSFVRIDVARDDDFALGPTYKYDSGVVVVAEAMAVAELVRRLTATFERGEDFPCGDLSLIDDRLKARWEAERLESGEAQNDYAAWPCIHASCELKQPMPKQEHGGPFISSDPSTPFHSDMLSLVREVAAFRKFHDFQDARRESAHLVIWDYRGRVREATCLPEYLDLELDGTELSDLILKGRVSGRSGSEAVHLDAGATMRVAVPDDCTRAHLVLIGGDGEVRDGRDFSNYPVWIAGSARDASAPDIGRLLSEGETRSLEVKPWVKLPGDDKLTEVVETVAAMANSGGGTVLVGAARMGHPHWDAKVLGPFLKRLEVPDGEGAEDQRRELAVVRYARQLSERLHERLNRSIDLVVRPERLPSGWLVCIIVPEGDEPPYRDGEDGRIVMRRNASNRWPSDEELRDLMRERGWGP